MSWRGHIVGLLLVLLAGVQAGCQSSQANLLVVPEEQSQLRSLQSRAFDTTDERMVLRAVLGAIQDLGFVIDDANAPLGIVTGTKYQGYDIIRITVTVYRRGETQTVVRASAQRSLELVTDPLAYQNFFTALSKSLFLEAHELDEAAPPGGAV